jgi:hypothetical protein
MELEVSAAVGARGVDPGIQATEQNLQRLIHGDTFSVIEKKLESPILELDIPLVE